MRKFLMFHNNNKVFICLFFKKKKIYFKSRLKNNLDKKKFNLHINL